MGERFDQHGRRALLAINHTGDIALPAVRPLRNSGDTSAGKQQIKYDGPSVLDPTTQAERLPRSDACGARQPQTDISTSWCMRPNGCMQT